MCILKFAYVKFIFQDYIMAWGRHAAEPPCIKELAKWNKLKL